MGDLLLQGHITKSNLTDKSLLLNNLFCFIEKLFAELLRWVWRQMNFIADICMCENTRDKILSVAKCGPDGEIEHEVIIQRAPKEFDVLDDNPGPRISCEDLDIDLAPGPNEIVFSGFLMIIILSGDENIEVDISGLDDAEQKELRVVAQELFR